MDFVRDHAGHRDPGGLRWGVEPICAVLTEHGLKLAPSTYYELVNRTPTARAVRDDDLLGQIRRVHVDNYAVYGARKVWLQLNREGFPVARCTVERLMQGGLKADGRRQTADDVLTTPADGRRTHSSREKRTLHRVLGGGRHGGFTAGRGMVWP